MPKSQFVDPKFLRAKGTIHFEDIPVNQYDRTVEQEKENYSKADFMRIYRDMAIIREFETMLYLIKTTNSYNGVEYNNPCLLYTSVQCLTPPITFKTCNFTGYKEYYARKSALNQSFFRFPSSFLHPL